MDISKLTLEPDADEIHQAIDGLMLEKFRAAIGKISTDDAAYIQSLERAICTAAVTSFFKRDVYLIFGDDRVTIGTSAGSQADPFGEILYEYEDVWCHLTEAGRDQLVRRLSALTFVPGEESEDVDRTLAGENREG